jgi:ATP-dependent DNA helicase RecQ
LEKSNEIIREATQKIINGEVEASRITKTVLVIDEAQDMDADEYALIQVLMEKNEEMRVIAVGMMTRISMNSEVRVPNT